MPRSLPASHPPEVRVPPRRSSKKSRARKVKQPGWVTFGAYIHELAAERRLTITQLANVLGTGRFMLSKIGNGYVGLPESALTGWERVKGRWRKRLMWAKALRFTPAEAEAFEKRAWLSLAPTQVIKRVEALEGRVVELEAEVASLRSKPRVRYIVPKGS